MIRPEALAVGVEMERDDTGQHEDERGQDFEDPGNENPLLPLGQTRRPEGALDDLLVRRPVKEIEKQHAGKKGGERHRGGGAADGIEFFRMRLFESSEPFNDTSITHRIEPEDEDHDPADEESEAIDRVRDGDSAQTAEDGVDRSHDPDEPDRDPEQGRLTLDAGDGLQVEDAHQPSRPSVENDGQQNRGVGENEDKARDRPGLRIKAEFKELGNRGNSAAQILW